MYTYIDLYMFTSHDKNSKYGHIIQYGVYNSLAYNSKNVIREVRIGNNFGCKKCKKKNIFYELLRIFTGPNF